MKETTGKTLRWKKQYRGTRGTAAKTALFIKMDKRYGRDTTVITRGKTTYELKDKDCPPNSPVKRLHFHHNNKAPRKNKGLRSDRLGRGIEFNFHQCGSMFLKDGVNIGKWNLNEQIKRAEEIQHELERLYG